MSIGGGNARRGKHAFHAGAARAFDQNYRGGRGGEVGGERLSGSGGIQKGAGGREGGEVLLRQSRTDCPEIVNAAGGGVGGDVAVQCRFFCTQLAHCPGDNQRAWRGGQHVYRRLE